MAACCGGNIPAFQALIQAGVSVNYTSGNTNSTLLHMAAYCGQVRMLPTFTVICVQDMFVSESLPSTKSIKKHEVATTTMGDLETLC